MKPDLKKLVIDIRSIPEAMHRYPTEGDWWFDNTTVIGNDSVLHVRVSDNQPYNSQVSIALHEAIEAILCRENGVTGAEVDKWDKEYEDYRGLLTPESDNDEVALPCGCSVTATSEPGDDIHSPYYRYHVAATLCESLIEASMPDPEPDEDDDDGSEEEGGEKKENI